MKTHRFIPDIGNLSNASTTLRKGVGIQTRVITDPNGVSTIEYTDSRTGEKLCRPHIEVADSQGKPGAIMYTTA